MKLFVDVTGKTFMVTKEAVEKADQNGRQKSERETGRPMWVTQVMALDETGGEMINVTTAGEKPTVIVGSQVALFKLEALPWATNGRNGVAFRAVDIKPAGASASK
ncbi:hypothetical protein [Planomonospora venezuelensis]|uniref:Regulatory protein n=1 Tax=Planomonospora venezuelensis TaxID=1999 RepID=A0A841DGN7_PLAVE|nr:hypothetical protein [Planomonospora venezuelensis]MBB5967883.1 hypothetical protein [Planomonospora venezuelensis]GIN03283.1 hypothetical protein Pve01_49410 [Planomonospora venezuelensis]